MKKSSSTAETVNALTSDLQQKLWHHSLVHPGKEDLRLESASCDGITKLHRHLLFQYSECIVAKLHKHKTGHHDKNCDAKIYREYEYPMETYPMAKLWCGGYNFMHGKIKAIIMITKAIEQHDEKYNKNVCIHASARTQTQ